MISPTGLGSACASSASSEFCWDERVASSEDGAEEEDRESPQWLCAKLQGIISRASSLLEQVHSWNEAQAPRSVVGIGKLRNKIFREIQNASNRLREMKHILAPMCHDHSGCETRGLMGSNAEEWMRCEAASRLLVQCSGIGTLELVARCLFAESQVVSVYTSFRVPPGSEEENSHRHASVEADIVSNDGRRWLKVRGGRMGCTGAEDVQSFLRIADELCAAASTQYLPFYQSPRVCVVVSECPAEEIVCRMRSLNVGLLVAPGEEEGWSSLFTEIALQPSFVCFDTTSLVALCSESCYRHHWSEKERLDALRSYPVLCEQQRRELCGVEAVFGFLKPYLSQYTVPMRESDVTCGVQRRVREWTGGSTSDSAAGVCYRPDLSWLRDLCATSPASPASPHVCGRDSKEVEWLDGDFPANNPGMCRNWLIADITYEEFKWMIETIAGWNECQRAFAVLQHCFVVNTSFLKRIAVNEKGSHPRIAQPYFPNGSAWYTTKTVKRTTSPLRNHIVFGMGEALEAITLSSNKQFYSKQLSVGVHLAVRLHPSRALTELKFAGVPRREGPTVPPPVDWEASSPNRTAGVSYEPDPSGNGSQ